MTQKQKIARRGAAVALSLLLGSAMPVLAQDNSGAKVLTPAEYAPAMLVQNGIAGVYEAVEAPELGALFVASTPSFDAKTPGFVDVLDPADLHQIRRIELPLRAFALGMDHKAGKLYVGNTLDGSLSVLDAKSGVLVDTIQLGKPDGEGFEHTRMVVVDEEGGRVFVSSPSEAGTLWIVNTADGNKVTRIDDAGLWAAGLAYDPTTKNIYVSGGGINEILVVNAETGERAGTISTGDTTEAGKDNSKHFLLNLAIDPAGKRLFAADANSGQLYVFDLETGKVVKTVPVGEGTLDVVYAAETNQIFVTYRGASREKPTGRGGVVVINGQDYTAQRSIQLPAHANSLELGQDGKVLYVTVKAPHGDDHPDYRVGGGDSVLRLDLAQLADAMK